MGKNIVICCDGTGNEYGDHNSNVVQMYQVLRLEDSQRQVAYYHPGVGTEGSPTSRTKMGAFFSVVAGLGFGTGLLGYVGDAYRYLMDTYEDGDNIYLFGFSRGAYTVRALSGMLQMFGLLHRGNDGLIAYILKMFAKRTKQAGGMSPEFAVAAGFKSIYSREVTLEMVGVWDTVSSVGMIWDPMQLPYTARNPIMKNGRHAVAIDEKRCFFRNNLWGVPFTGQSIKQVWFPGVHCDVGGSYLPAESGLSQGAMQWMLCEAVQIGLLVDPLKANAVLGRGVHPPFPPDARGPLHRSLKGPWWILEYIPHQHYDPVTKKKGWILPRARIRTIPAGSVFHESVGQKWDVDATYRPENLPEGWRECTEPAVACEFEGNPARG